MFGVLSYNSVWYRRVQTTVSIAHDRDTCGRKGSSDLSKLCGGMYGETCLTTCAGEVGVLF